MFDLPPQVYAVESHQVETVVAAEKYQIPFAGSRNTILRVNNQTGYKVYITSTLDNMNQWYNGANPYANFNGVAIEGSNYLSRNENVNSDSPNATFTMYLTFTARSGDEQIGMRVNQMDVVKPDTINTYYPTFKVGFQDFTGYFRVDQQIWGNENIFTISNTQ